jgi:hypothetical protein
VKARLNPYQAAPDAMKSLTALDAYIAGNGLEPSLIEPVRTRAFVLSGAIRSESSATGRAKIYKSGESFFEPSGSKHLVSATEPASLLAVFVADDGAQLTVFDK